MGALVTLLALAALSGASAFWLWSRRGGALGAPVTFDVEPRASARSVSERLGREGLIAEPRLFELYLRITRSDDKLVSGPHLVRRGLSPAAMAARLIRSPTRDLVKVTIPEGYTRFQIAERLAQRDVAPEAGFGSASVDPELLASLGVTATSAEGYLFPATYELHVDTDPRQVVRLLVRESFRRFQELGRAHPKRIEALAATGWGMHQILTLASMVEKEAARADERGPIASVFFNRLNDPTFKPRQMLQSDPTAGYGCLLARDRLASCRNYDGTITPAMLRDPDNEYNTYRRPGLPPGPIANPGAAAIAAVLDPPETPYLFFVADSSKRHVFSRTFSEHARAIATRAGRDHDARTSVEAHAHGDPPERETRADATRGAPP